ncbi:TPA: hypothetical protein LLS86_004515 [Serratia liquefaciens]|nr:hypothetical protein [Serratia liquefaciens]
MNTQNMIEFIEKLSPALIGFAGAWFGSRWGLAKFKKEKFWEAKVQAYGQIIAAVESIAFWGQQERVECYCGITIGKDADHHSDKFHSALRLTMQMEHTASIYLSVKFIGLINKFNLDVQREYGSTIEDLRGEDHIVTYYVFADLAGRISDEAYKTLDALNAQAEADLSGSMANFCKILKEKCIPTTGK